MSLVVALLLLLLSGSAFSHAYYNSTETGCDGTDSTVLMCDDFEDGVWYATDCDTSGGITNAANDGWCGNPFDAISPANAIISGVTPFGTYAGNGGAHSGTGGQNMALHHFKTSGCGSDGTQLCAAGNEIYVRWYAYWTTSYSFGAEKHMNITNADGDIAFANVQLNCGTGSASSTATPYIQVINTTAGDDFCQSPNIASITLQSNHWYFFEFYVKLSSTGTAHDGIARLWVNDCGTAGTSCGASPTLRTERTDVAFSGNANGRAIETVWLENWANPASTGTGPYWDNLKVATTGPIGFTGSESEDTLHRLAMYLTGLAALAIALGGFYGKAVLDSISGGGITARYWVRLSESGTFL